mgnify:CR=1 FL=1
MQSRATAPVHSHAGCRRTEALDAAHAEYSGVLLMRWLRWQGVISTDNAHRGDHLIIRGARVKSGKSPAVIKVQGQAKVAWKDGGGPTFPSTLSMLQLASRHRMAYVL